MGAASKPSFGPRVGHPLRGDGHSSTSWITPKLERYTPRSRAGSSWLIPASFSILLQVGFTDSPCHHGVSVSSYLTLSPLPPDLGREAVYFLWHFPWGHPRWPLTSTIALRSSDFPPVIHRSEITGDHPVYSHFTSPRNLALTRAWSSKNPTRWAFFSPLAADAGLSS